MKTINAGDIVYFKDPDGRLGRVVIKKVNSFRAFCPGINITFCGGRWVGQKLGQAVKLYGETPEIKAKFEAQRQKAKELIIQNS